MKAYLAGSIFYIGDEYRNTAWAKLLRETFPNMDLFNPLEADYNGVEGKKRFGDAKMIADGDNKRLDETDILIACIDGDVIGSGVSAEVGRFSALIDHCGKKGKIVGICTDNRQCYLTHSEEKDIGGAAQLGNQQYSYQNLFTCGLILNCGILVTNIDDAIAYIKSIEHEFE